MILGDYYYTFPKKQKLKLRLKDMLEDNVDESLYFTEEKIKQKYYNNLNVESYPNCTEEEKKIALSKFDLFLQWQQFFQKYKGIVRCCLRG